MQVAKIRSLSGSKFLLICELSLSEHKKQLF
jgi:hypothetical protein